MKKITMAILVCALTALSAAAYEMKGSFYFGPYVGYKIFDDKSNFDNNVEAGLKLGYFLTENWAVELSGGYVDAKDNKKDKYESVTTPGLHVLYNFRPEVDKALLPFISAGVESRITEHETDTGLALGAGIKYLFTKHIAGDVSYKNIFYGAGKNDQLVAFSLGVFFGVKDEKVAEPFGELPAEPLVEEVEPVAEAVVMEEVVEEVAVVVVPVDSDGDGVTDDKDLCPNTPAGYSVDVDGCFTNMSLLINFKNDSNSINEDSMDKVKEFADFLKENPEINVEVQGYTDSVGRAAYNLQLSEKRAKAVAAALVKFGIDSKRIQTKGYGATDFIAPNNTPEGRAANRRIETISITLSGDEVQSQVAE